MAFLLLAVGPGQTSVAETADGREASGEVGGRAFAYFCQAALRGRPTAAFQLGWMYLKGRGAERDPARAGYWLGKAARGGDGEAAALIRANQLSTSGADPDCPPRPGARRAEPPQPTDTRSRAVDANPESDPSEKTAGASAVQSVQSVGLPPNASAMDRPDGGGAESDDGEQARLTQDPVDIQTDAGPGGPSPLAPAASPAASAAYAGSSCLQIHHRDAAVRRDIKAWLEARGLSPRTVQIEVPYGTIYQVYREPLATDGAARAELERLKARGIRDALVIRTGVLKHGITLGAYRREDDARKRVSELGSQGVLARYRTQNPMRRQDWLRFSGMADDTGALRARFADIRIQLAESCGR
ncbi:MAG: tetratricopeptide repeat protein [Gammaproteobacteria bacterium]